MTTILNGRPFASIAHLLNNYIIRIEIIGKKEKVSPYRVVASQLQSNAKALSRIRTTNKSDIIEATCNRLFEEQFKL